MTFRDEGVRLDELEATSKSPMDIDTNSLRRSKSQRLKKGCPFCSVLIDKYYQYDVIEFCTQHNSPFTCLLKNCNCVFLSADLFSKHYRWHTKVDSRAYLCRTCYTFMDSRRAKSSHEASHEAKQLTFYCCSMYLPTMMSFVLHKFQKHAVEIIMSTAECKIDYTVTTNTPILSNKIKSDLFTCLVSGCNKVFNMESTYRVHYTQHIKESKNNVNYDEDRIPLLSCATCVSEFESVYDLAIHKLINHRSIVLCYDQEYPACPVCGKELNVLMDSVNHYLNCFSESIIENHIKKVMISNLDESTSNSTNIPVENKKGFEPVNPGLFKCKVLNCEEYCESVQTYIDHCSKKHKMCYNEKKKGLKNCPLCFRGILEFDFNNHLEICTNKTKIEDDIIGGRKRYSCMWCSSYYILRPNQYRNHLLHCRSFATITENGASYYGCRNCTYTTKNYDESVQHVSYTCIYQQLRKMFECEADEKERAEEFRIEDLNSLKGVIDKQCSENGIEPKNLYSCTKCYRPFASYEERESHLTQQCEKMFVNKPVSVSVSVSDDTIIEPFKCRFFCDKCQKLFYNKDLFQSHEAMHAKEVELLLSCSQCDSKFFSKVHYENHPCISSQLFDIPRAVPIEVPRAVPIEEVPKDEPFEEVPKVQVKYPLIGLCRPIKVDPYENENLTDNDGNILLNNIKMDCSDTQDDKNNLNDSYYDAPSTSYGGEEPMECTYDEENVGHSLHDTSDVNYPSHPIDVRSHHGI